MFLRNAGRAILRNNCSIATRKKRKNPPSRRSLGLPDYWEFIQEGHMRYQGLFGKFKRLRTLGREVLVLKDPRSPEVQPELVM